MSGVGRRKWCKQKADEVGGSWVNSYIQKIFTEMKEYSHIK